MAGIGLLSVKSGNRLGDRDRECFHASRSRDSTFEHSSKDELYTRTVGLKRQPDSLDKPLPALPGVIVAPMPDCDALPLTKPCRDPSMVFFDYADDIELQEMGREQGRSADRFSMDDGVEGSDEDTALLPTSTSGFQKRRSISSSGKRTLNVYFQKGGTLLKRQLRFLCSILHYDPSYHKLGGTIAPRNEDTLAVQCPAPKFISERQFWLMLERFFGLVSLPDSLVNTFPTQGQIAYIQNFLQSQPTPREGYQKTDSRKELVKVCIKLTAFIFRDRESKRIFIGVGRQSHGSQDSPWKIFQGFGLIERYLVETGNGRRYACTDEGLVLWLQKRGYHTRVETTLQIWSSLNCLYWRHGNVTQMRDPSFNPARGLQQIYRILSASHSSSSGWFNIDFSNLLRRSTRVERARDETRMGYF